MEHFSHFSQHSFEDFLVEYPVISLGLGLFNKKQTGSNVPEQERQRTAMNMFVAVCISTLLSICHNL